MSETSQPQEIDLRTNEILSPELASIEENPSRSLLEQSDFIGFTPPRTPDIDYTLRPDRILNFTPANSPTNEGYDNRILSADGFNNVLDRFHNYFINQQEAIDNTGTLGRLTLGNTVQNSDQQNPFDETTSNTVINAINNADETIRNNREQDITLYYTSTPLHEQIAINPLAPQLIRVTQDGRPVSATAFQHYGSIPEQVANSCPIPGFTTRRLHFSTDLIQQPHHFSAYSQSYNNIDDTSSTSIADIPNPGSTINCSRLLQLNAARYGWDNSSSSESSDTEDSHNQQTNRNNTPSPTEPLDLSQRSMPLADFNVTTFHKIIPEYSGDTDTLHIFLSRCDNYHDTLTPAGKMTFVANLIYKLNGRAFIIYQAKTPTDWKTLRKELADGIADKKSIPTLQNELLLIKQLQHQTVTEFAENIRKKLKQLSDKVRELYEAATVQRSFFTEHEKMAVRAFKEGLLPPLKYRMLASTETTFDKIRQLALEEEPFIPQHNNTEQPQPASSQRSNFPQRQSNQPRYPQRNPERYLQTQWTPYNPYRPNETS